MASAVADLEAGLQAMLNLKPPGVSGSRINNLTSLCVANIQSESVLIQKIYTHFKKTPGTHKLGVLYVVDSVTRKWLEQAKAQGQPINSSAQDGTYAAGVHRVTELMPVLMNDILSSIPEEQKEKVKKLLDIWEKGQTFPGAMLDSFKEKLAAPPTQNSTTPPGSPPANVLAPNQSNGTSAPAAAASSGSSILEALANIARQNTTSAPSNANLPAPAASYSMPASNLPQPVSSVHHQQQQQPVTYPSNPQPVNMPPMPFSLPQVSGQVAQPGYPGTSNPPPNSYGAPAQTGAPAGGSALDSNTQQQIMLIKALADQGVPFDKIPALIQSMTGNSGAAAAAAAAQPAAAVSGQNPYAQGQPSWGAPAHGGKDRGYEDGGRSPPRYGRTRSRSPDRWDSRDSPRGRRDRGDYGRDSPPRGRNDDRSYNSRRGGNDYRQRSPPRRYGQSPTPPDEFPKVDKWVEYDSSLPSGHIKVLSRTLFVGGVTCPESQLRNIFSRFGTVQTCIVNKEKRHAFVKMLSRKDAVSAKDGTEDGRGLELPLRTRWGVGFGPRDCSDYQTGISVIPIHRLTEADRKWMLTAPYGGSGGRDIVGGLCVEEPDIEIGAGVSSKAISRRMQTDKGGSNGPKSTRHRDEESGRSRRGWDDDVGAHRGDQPNAGQQSLGAGFPFGIGTLPNGMPNFPAGFAFPDPNGGGQ